MSRQRRSTRPIRCWQRSHRETGPSARCRPRNPVTVRNAAMAGRAVAAGNAATVDRAEMVAPVATGARDVTDRARTNRATGMTSRVAADHVRVVRAAAPRGARDIARGPALHAATRTRIRVTGAPTHRRGGRIAATAPLVGGVQTEIDPLGIADSGGTGGDSLDRREGTALVGGDPDVDHRDVDAAVLRP